MLNRTAVINGNSNSDRTSDWQTRSGNQINKPLRMRFRSLNTLFAVIAITALSSCSTMVSKEMLPGIEYRKNPIVEIVEYDDHARLQEDCIKQHTKAYVNYFGCTLVPHDPTQKCIIRIMAGDDRTKKHELAHCQGHADTVLPWMVDSDFYDNIDLE